MNQVSDMYGEAPHPDHCCNRAAMMWLEDEILAAAIDRRPMPTDAIDQLPPWRARMLVLVCAAAGVPFEHGDLALFDQASLAAARSNPKAQGWWRKALGLPAAPCPTRPAPRNERRVPASWQGHTPAAT